MKPYTVIKTIIVSINGDVLKYEQCFKFKGN